jgi:hypothetical protein
MGKLTNNECFESWVLTVIAFVLLLIGIFVVAGVLALISTALGITSYILMRSEPAGAELLPVEAAAIGPNNGPSQQQPPVVIMVWSTSVLANRSG